MVDESEQADGNKRTQQLRLVRLPMTACRW
jgi:hypothetical protein